MFEEDNNKKKIYAGLIVVGLVALLIALFYMQVKNDYNKTQEEIAQLNELKRNAIKEEIINSGGFPLIGLGGVLDYSRPSIMGGELQGNSGKEDSKEEVKVENNKDIMLSEYAAMYKKNEDIVGWLRIEDTQIDNPVMQTMEDEEYYLNRGFDKKNNKNGSLLLDTDSYVGIGNREEGYIKDKKPSTNLIIHGHTMSSGLMFGDLQMYKDENYAKEHSKIYFDSLYEKREYEVISAFYTQVFYENQNVFKYYKFFEANNTDEFDDWYGNIKKLSLYDSNVTAEYGDEFITLSCCAYQVDDGRFVVIGKRIK